MIALITGLIIGIAIGITLMCMVSSETYNKGFMDGKGNEYVRGFSDGETETIKYFDGK